MLRSAPFVTLSNVVVARMPTWTLPFVWPILLSFKGKAEVMAAVGLGRKLLVWRKSTVRESRGSRRGE
jgi:hypothetical protein